MSQDWGDNRSITIVKQKGNNGRQASRDHTKYSSEWN